MKTVTSMSELSVKEINEVINEVKESQNVLLKVVEEQRTKINKLISLLEEKKKENEIVKPEIIKIKDQLEEIKKVRYREILKLVTVYLTLLFNTTRRYHGSI